MQRARGTEEPSSRAPAGPPNAQSSWLAWPAGTDPDVLSRTIMLAHDDFLANGRADGAVRSLVAQSWARCLSEGVDPEYSLAPVDLVGAELQSHRDEHPLAQVMPVIRRLLVEDATDAGLLVAVSDAAGRLLWVEGDSRLRTLAEHMNFAAGANWSESSAGTNAPGTALALDHAVQIFGAEHLSRFATPWSCSAAPIHDPDTGAVLGSLDLTGGDAVASPYTLSLVRAAVAAVESELRVFSLTGQRGQRPRSAARAPRTSLELLGRSSGLLRHPDGETRLSLRHSEVLTLLASYPDGLSASQLASNLNERESARVTVRAEMSRLRALLGDVRLESRPYRLVDPLETDAAKVNEHLDHARYRQAAALYRGPLLPQSEAPGVVRLREDLHGRLRAALIGLGEPDGLLRFADTDHGRDDLDVWTAALRALPVGSPRHAQVLAHVTRLEAELSVPAATFSQPPRT